MVSERLILALFADEAAAEASVRALADGPWPVRQVYSPVPSHRLLKAMNAKKSVVGWFTLTGGILGFVSGFALAAFTASRWSLIVSGKPVLSWVPFVIVGFEFTILFAVFGNIVGLISQTRLPDINAYRQLNPGCTGDRFGVLAACPGDQTQALMDRLTQLGGEPREIAAGV